MATSNDKRYVCKTCGADIDRIQHASLSPLGIKKKYGNVHGETWRCPNGHDVSVVQHKS